jgi:hypothetical protein
MCGKLSRNLNYATKRCFASSEPPYRRINYKDAIFASIPDGLGWNVVHHDWWKAESPAKLRFGRDEERGGSPFLIAGGVTHYAASTTLMQLFCWEASSRNGLRQAALILF